MCIEQKGFKRSTLSACYRAFFMRNSLHISQTIHVISTMTIVCAVPAWVYNEQAFFSSLQDNVIETEFVENLFCRKGVLLKHEYVYLKTDGILFPQNTNLTLIIQL